jgi:RNA polymerase sigma-70 factor (ECF subfamily)
LGQAGFAGVISMMSPETLGHLMDAHADALVLYARQWCQAPEDIVQEAFLKLSSLASPPASTLAWLYRVVRNGAISQGRQAKRRRHHEGAAAAQAAWFVRSQNSELDIQSTTVALEALPDLEREVIVAHLWGGLTFEEIAELMNSSKSSVHRTYVAGLSNLREKLGVACPKSSTTRN